MQVKERGSVCRDCSYEIYRLFLLYFSEILFAILLQCDTTIEGYLPAQTMQT